jgi:hypothetical protein
MPIQSRTSGITIEASGEVTAGPPLKLRGKGRTAAPVTRGAARRRGAATVASAVPLSEEEAIVAAFGDQQLELVEAIPLEAPAPAGPRTRGATRGGVGPRGDVRINVPVSSEETAVVLVERDGVYEWLLDGTEGPAPVAPPPGPRSRGARKAAPSATRTLTFSVAIPEAPAPAAPVTRGASRGGLLRKLGVGKVVAYVFRFVARKVLKGLMKFLERGVREGLVHIQSPDPATWVTLADDVQPRLPPDRAARVLLLVHGTFSSTLGSYGALGAHPEGQAMLRAALAHYDLVIGWDHRSLSALPTDNAIDIVARLERLGFTRPPQVDAVAYSRGGLVLRSLIEHVLPASPLKLDLQRAVFVACTHGGTELARAENWHRFADRYLNVAAAGARAVALVPGFNAAGAVLAGAISGVAVLVKALTSAAIKDEGIPGLAAMDPDGEFIREINKQQPGQPTPEQSFYCVVTSSFDTKTAEASISKAVMSPTLIQKLADRGADVLYRKVNDLVVHVDSMTQIDVDAGAYVDGKLEFGVNGHVHHCNYFAQPETAQALVKWFELPVATPRSRSAVSRGAAKKKASRSPSRGK